MNSPRDDLSRALGDLRRDAGLSQAQLAERAELTIKSLSRYENGKIAPPLATVERLADAMRLKPAQRRQLVQLAEDVREGTESRLVFLRSGSGGAQRMQARIARVEASSRLVRSFANQLVVGMLQSSAYMRAVFASANLTEDEVRASVATRQGRLTQALAATDTQYVQLVTEGALHWNIGGPAAMAEQMAHLEHIAVNAPDHFRVGVIPAEQSSGLTVMGSFDVYDERAAVVGIDVATAWMGARDAQTYGALHDQLAGLARFGADAVPTLRRLRERYRSMEAT